MEKYTADKAEIAKNELIIEKSREMIKKLEAKKEGKSEFRQLMFDKRIAIEGRKISKAEKLIKMYKTFKQLTLFSE